MARPSNSFTLINDLSLDGRVLRDADWNWNSEVEYRAGDLSLGSDNILYICTDTADNRDPAMGANPNFWTAVSSSGGSGSNTTYTFASGMNGQFTVTPSDTNAPQIVDVGSQISASFDDSTRVLSLSINNGATQTVTIPEAVNDERNVTSVSREGNNLIVSYNNPGGNEVLIPGNTEIGTVTITPTLVIPPPGTPGTQENIDINLSIANNDVWFAPQSIIRPANLTEGRLFTIAINFGSGLQISNDNATSRFGFSFPWTSGDGFIELSDATTNSGFTGGMLTAAQFANNFSQAFELPITFQTGNDTFALTDVFQDGNNVYFSVTLEEKADNSFLGVIDNFLITFIPNTTGIFPVGTRYLTGLLTRGFEEFVNSEGESIEVPILENDIFAVGYDTGSTINVPAFAQRAFVYIPIPNYIGTVENFLIDLGTASLATNTTMSVAEFADFLNTNVVFPRSRTINTAFQGAAEIDGRLVLFFENFLRLVRTPSIDIREDQNPQGTLLLPGNIRRVIGRISNNPIGSGRTVSSDAFVFSNFRSISTPASVTVRRSIPGRLTETVEIQLQGLTDPLEIASAVRTGLVDTPVADGDFLTDIDATGSFTLATFVAETMDISAVGISFNVNGTVIGTETSEIATQVRTLQQTHSTRIRVSTPVIDETINLSSGIRSNAVARRDFINKFNADSTLTSFFQPARLDPNNTEDIMLTVRGLGNVSITINFSRGSSAITSREDPTQGQGTPFQEPSIEIIYADETILHSFLGPHTADTIASEIADLIEDAGIYRASADANVVSFESLITGNSEDLRIRVTRPGFVNLTDPDFVVNITQQASADRRIPGNRLVDVIPLTANNNDNRTAMEIIRSAIFDSNTIRSTTFSNGFPSVFTYTLANSRTIVATFVFSNGLPLTTTFSGNYIHEVVGRRADLVHRYTFVNGLPSRDTWEFMQMFDLRLTTSGLIVESDDLMEQIHITQSGLLAEINNDILTITESGLIVEVA